MFNKSLQTFMDSFSLYEHGSINSTYLLWRSIYENYVITLYLIDGPEEEAKLFNLYGNIQLGKLLKSQMTKEQKDNIVKLFGEDFNNDYCWAKRISGTKSFSKIVKYTKEKDHYGFYKLSTYIGHSTSLSVNKKMLFQDNISNTEMIGYFPDEATHSLNTFLTLLTNYSKIILNKFADEKHSKLLSILIEHFAIEIDKNREL
ncbi:hypothetical protein FACS189444_0010 [Spirochaetia bacterium]|nr:hypothetical protein FACS189444_0010 [Spirochaetia bacterium]